MIKEIQTDERKIHKRLESIFASCKEYKRLQNTFKSLSSQQTIISERNSVPNPRAPTELTKSQIQ